MHFNPLANEYADLSVLPWYSVTAVLYVNEAYKLR